MSQKARNPGCEVWRALSSVLPPDTAAEGRGVLFQKLSQEPCRALGSLMTRRNLVDKNIRERTWRSVVMSWIMALISGRSQIPAVARPAERQAVAESQSFRGSSVKKVTEASLGCK